MTWQTEATQTAENWTTAADSVLYEQLDVVETGYDFLVVQWSLSAAFRAVTSWLVVYSNEASYPTEADRRSLPLDADVTKYRLGNLTASTRYKLCVGAFQLRSDPLTTVLPHAPLSAPPHSSPATAAAQSFLLGRECIEASTSRWTGHVTYAGLFAALFAFLFLCCCIVAAKVLYRRNVRKKRLRRMEVLKAEKGADEDDVERSVAQSEQVEAAPTYRSEYANRLERPSSGAYDDESLYPKVDNLPPCQFLPPAAPPDQCATRVMTQMRIDIPMVRPVPRHEPIRFIYSEQPIAHRLIDPSY